MQEMLQPVYLIVITRKEMLLLTCNYKDCKDKHIQSRE